MKREARRSKGADVNQIPAMRLLKVIVIVLCLSGILSFSMFMIKFADVANENDVVLAQIEAQEEQSHRLLAQIEEADTPAFIEMEARKAGMGYDDEIIFIDRNVGNFENSGD